MILNQKKEYKGLKIGGDVDLSGNIIVIIGGNGSGKTRLLEALSEGAITIDNGFGELSKSDISYFGGGLNAKITHDYNVRQREEKRFNVLEAFRSLKMLNKESSVGSRVIPSKSSRDGGVDMGFLDAAIASVKIKTGKKISEMQECEILDFYSEGSMRKLGEIDIRATMLEYFYRKEENEINFVRNGTFGQSLPYKNEEDFLGWFGPPPWEVFNDFLAQVFGGRYRINPPSHDDISNYKVVFFRNDGAEIDQNFFSSGEKALMWLALSMLGSSSKVTHMRPKILLLDEPDSALHPQMIQTMYSALEFIWGKFNCKIIITTHSPTTVALLQQGRIYKIKENGISLVDKDMAIAELLDGVDQVSVFYSNRKQVYVESNNDADAYTTLYGFLKRWGYLNLKHISLSFIPAAAKLASGTIMQTCKAVLKDVDEDRLKILVNALNGHGSCERVRGAVEVLRGEGNVMVYGIVDWDLKNVRDDFIEVMGENEFYTIENSILNPVSLGLYLLSFFPSEFCLEDCGLDSGTEIISLYHKVDAWQLISDEITKKIIGDASGDRRYYTFLGGAEIEIDSRYMLMKGDILDAKIREVFKSLNMFRSNNTLINDVLKKGVVTAHGRTILKSVKDVFDRIQAHK